MDLFAFESYRGMAEALKAPAGLTSAQFRVARFENGELHVEVQSFVKAESGLILGSISPPDEQLLSALLLAHTLKKEGARRVTAVFPYLGYARHDKVKPGESLATAWVGKIVQASGIDQAIAVDVHSERAAALSPVPWFRSPPPRFSRML